MVAHTRFFYDPRQRVNLDLLLSYEFKVKVPDLFDIDNDGGYQLTYFYPIKKVGFEQFRFMRQDYDRKTRKLVFVEFHPPWLTYKNFNFFKNIK